MEAVVELDAIVVAQSSDVYSTVRLSSHFLLQDLQLLGNNEFVQRGQGCSSRRIEFEMFVMA